MIDPSEDYLNIVAAEQQMRDVAKKRQLESDELNEKLQSMSARGFTIPSH